MLELNNTEMIKFTSNSTSAESIHIVNTLAEIQHYLYIFDSFPQIMLQAQNWELTQVREGGYKPGEGRHRLCVSSAKYGQ